MIGYLVHRLLLLAAPRVPRALGLRLARWLGAVAAVLSPRRHAVDNNLGHVLGAAAAPDAVRRTRRAVFRNQTCNYFDMFHFAGRPVSEIRDVATFDDLPLLLEGQRTGVPTVVVTVHFGNLDVVALRSALAGVDALAVAERLEPASLFRLVCRARTRTGLELVPVDAAPRTVLRALRANRTVVLAADRDVSGPMIRLPVFGVPASVPDGYARLARRTGARILVVYARRLADDRFVLYSRGLPDRPPSTDDGEDARRTVAAVWSVLEEAIRETPDQWVLFRRLWDDAPDAAQATKA